MLHLLGALGNAQFSHSLGRTWKCFDPCDSGKAVCVCAHPHASSPFPFHISRADFTSQTQNTSSHLQPTWLFSLFRLICH